MQKKKTCTQILLSALLIIPPNCNRPRFPDEPRVMQTLNAKATAGHPPRSDRSNLVTMEKGLRVFKQWVGKSTDAGFGKPGRRIRKAWPTRSEEASGETLDSFDRQVSHRL